jgi:hypothetical protein
MDAVRSNANPVNEYNAITRGWIPEFLPEEAIQIKERHNLDTNEGWGTFTYIEVDITKIEKNWERKSKVMYPGDPNRFSGKEEFEWSLSDESKENIFYNETFWLVIDTHHNVGYFWQL